jgi:predicted anti-sigma-YlaC factor YlaD
VASEHVDLHGVPTPVDRRKQRIHLPSCEACRSPKTAVATRTEYVVYVRCAACGFVWSMPKPGREAPGS